MSVNTYRYNRHEPQSAYRTLGIKLPMNGERGTALFKVFDLSRTTEEQSISNYVNLLFTMPGERYMQPQFGIGIQLYLFENSTDATLSKLRREIQEQSGRWLPYITNHSIELKTSDDINIAGVPLIADNALIVSITFSVGQHGANHEIAIFPTDGSVQYKLL